MLMLTAAGAASGAYRDTGTITTAHLILIGVLAAIVVAAILWGMRQKRARIAAQEQEAERADELLAHPQTETAVSPAPPPLGDAGVTATAPRAVTPLATSEPEPAAPPPPSLSATKAGFAPTPTAAYPLTAIKGLGPKAVPLLAEQGVADLAALAALSPARAAEVDGGMGALRGRMTRDRWVEQAKLLAAGDVAGFEATFGKL